MMVIEIYTISDIIDYKEFENIEAIGIFNNKYFDVSVKIEEKINNTRLILRKTRRYTLPKKMWFDTQGSYYVFKTKDNTLKEMQQWFLRIIRKENEEAEKLFKKEKERFFS